MSTESDEYALSGYWVEDAVAAYKDAFHWTDTENAGEYTGEEIDLLATADVESFLPMVEGIVTRLGMSADKFGWNFYLTSTYSGTGFWDMGLGDDGDELTRLTHEWSDGWVHRGQSPLGM